MLYNNQQATHDMDIPYNQQKFLEHSAFAEHFERMKIVNAANDTDYYMYAELEYYHKSKAMHYKGMFSAASTIIKNK